MKLAIFLDIFHTFVWQHRMRASIKVHSGKQLDYSFVVRLGVFYLVMVACVGVNYSLGDPGDT